MRAATGIEGLDDLFGGGLPEHHLYLIEGDPGAGKTTMALQFLMAGRDRGEQVLYITLSESERELREGARSHGWSTEGIRVFELRAAQQNALGNDVSIFHPGEIELGEAMKTLLEEVQRHDPKRVVFDSLSEIRLLAQQPLRYRRQILALKQFFADRKCTVLMLDDRTAEPDDKQVMSIAHGALSLEATMPSYGVERRRMRVVKIRGSAFRGGFHDYVIERGGLRVFPRLIAAESRDARIIERVPSGNADFDRLLGGGLARGTSTLVLGPPGSGKSAVVSTIAAAVAARGEKGITYLFDETVNAYLARCEGLGIPIAPHVESGTHVIQQVDPAELSPGELVHRVRGEVERGARFIAIDSLNGYLNAMPEERFLVIQLHELLMYLAQKGTLTFLVAPQHGVLGETLESCVEVSYLADTVILLRYFEAEGRVRSALSVVKQRTGRHEKTIRELELGPGGFRVGHALSAFRGVLTGVPEFVGGKSELLPREGE